MTLPDMDPEDIDLVGELAPGPVVQMVTRPLI